MKLYTICSKIVYSDASQSGYAGYEVQSINGVAHGQWSAFESGKSSTWRELKAVLNVILSLRGILAHSRIKWFTDNTSVCHIVEMGSMKRDLQDIATEIFSFCTVNCISLEIEWLPHTLNQQADYLSKVIDCNDWGLAVSIFNLLNQLWGPFEIDWFASEHNAKVAKFYARFWSPSCSGVDAFTENWGNVNGLFVPPINLITRVLLHMAICRAYSVLVVPLWRSSSFWPMLCTENGTFIHNVIEMINLPTDKASYMSCKSGRGMFRNDNLKFRMLALRIDFRS